MASQMRETPRGLNVRQNSNRTTGMGRCGKKMRQFHLAIVRSRRAETINADIPHLGMPKVNVQIILEEL